MIIKDYENGLEKLKRMYTEFKSEHEVIPIDQLQILNQKISMILNIMQSIRNILIILQDFNKQKRIF